MNQTCEKGFKLFISYYDLLHINPYDLSQVYWHFLAYCTLQSGAPTCYMEGFGWDLTAYVGKPVKMKNMIKYDKKVSY